MMEATKKVWTITAAAIVQTLIDLDLEVRDSSGRVISDEELLDLVTAEVQHSVGVQHAGLLQRKPTVSNQSAIREQNDALSVSVGGGA